MVIEKKVDLPKQIPKVFRQTQELLFELWADKFSSRIQGQFSVLADVLTKDEEKVACLHAEGIRF